MDSPGTNTQPPEQVTQQCLVNVLTTVVLCEHEMPQQHQPTDVNNIAALRSLSIHLKPHVMHFLTNSQDNAPFFNLVENTGHPLPVVLNCIMTAASEIFLAFYNQHNINPTNSCQDNKTDITNIISSLCTTHIKHTKMIQTPTPELSKLLDVSQCCTHLKLRTFFLQMAVDSYNQAYQKRGDEISQEFVPKARKHYFTKINNAYADLIQLKQQNTKLPTLVETIGKHHPRCVLKHLADIGLNSLKMHQDIFPQQNEVDEDNYPAPNTQQHRTLIKQHMMTLYNTNYANIASLDHTCEEISLQDLRCYPVSTFVDVATGEILPLELGNA